MQTEVTEPCEAFRLQLVNPTSIFNMPPTIPLGHNNNISTIPGMSVNHCHRINFEFNLEDHVKKTRKAAKYLKQIYHSRDCGGNCHDATCKKVSVVLRHSLHCITSNCPIPGCITTKSLLQHSQECCHSPFAKKINTITPSPVTPKPSDQCMLCTIALSGYMKSQFTSFSTDHIDAQGIDMNLTTEEDGGRFQPLIHDEIRNYNRVPFQEFNTYHTMKYHNSIIHPQQQQEPTYTKNQEEEDLLLHHVPRAKTFSDSDFVTTPTSSLSGLSSNTIIHDSQPMKKARSKSMSVAYSGATPLF